MMRCLIFVLLCLTSLPAQHLYMTGRNSFYALREIDPLSAVTLNTGTSWGSGGTQPYIAPLVHDGAVLARVRDWHQPIDPSDGSYATNWPLWSVVPYGTIWDASYDYTREEYVATTNNREIYSTPFMGSHQVVLQSSPQYTPGAVAVSRNGNIWFWDYASLGLHRLDRNTGLVSQPVTVSIGPVVSSLAFHPSNGLLYASTGNNSTAPGPLELYAIDTATGNTMFVGTHGIEVASIAFSPVDVIGGGGEGRTGTTLTLGVNAPPSLGTATFALRLANLHGDLYGGAQTFLFLANGLAPQPIPFSSGNFIYLDQASTLFHVQSSGFPLMQTLMWTERTTEWAFPIPNAPSLLGATAHLQAAVVDASFTNGIRFSNALRLRIY